MAFDIPRLNTFMLILTVEGDQNCAIRTSIMTMILSRRDCHLSKPAIKLCCGQSHTPLSVGFIHMPHDGCLPFPLECRNEHYWHSCNLPHITVENLFPMT